MKTLEITTGKGQYGENCNVTHCQKPSSAFYFNTGTRSYYCRECRDNIQSIADKNNTVLFSPIWKGLGYGKPVVGEMCRYSNGYTGEHFIICISAIDEEEFSYVYKGETYTVSFGGTNLLGMIPKVGDTCAMRYTYGTTWYKITILSMTEDKITYIKNNVKSDVYLSSVIFSDSSIHDFVRDQSVNRAMDDLELTDDQYHIAELLIDKGYIKVNKS